MTPALPRPGDLDALEAAIIAMSPTVRAVKREVDDTTATPIYIDYRLAPTWYEGVDEAIDRIDDLVVPEPTGAILLAEHALQRLEHADLDDSDGWLMQAFPRLEHAHAAACERLGLTGAALARRLSALASESELEAFHQAPDSHANALGDAGINHLLRSTLTDTSTTSRRADSNR